LDPEPPLDDVFILVVITAIIIIEGLGYHTDKRLADVISQEVTEVED
jgi:hypothetical protein